jgi:hypothetical protein
MKKKLLFLPLILLGILLALNWGCDKLNDDVCKAFEPKSCESANSCCPTDGGNCYYEYNGTKYYCDKSKATTSDPDGCDEAENKVIASICSANGKIDIMAIKASMRKHIKNLMQEARIQSVCN